MDKEQLLDNVRGWISIDNEIKQLQKVIKEKRKEKKAYTANLVEVMKSNDIQCFDISDGKLLYTQNKVKSALSKKHLIKSLTEWFKDDPTKIGDLTKHILNSREEKIKENIKRKIKK
tara:strand:- start:45 stop:395 length:351 start_codon:yes stop_codon:yes gene_type:complete